MKTKIEVFGCDNIAIVERKWNFVSLTNTLWTVKYRGGGIILCDLAAWWAQHNVDDLKKQNM